MEFNQEIVIGASRQKVWDFIWNIEEFASCVPCVTHVEKVDDTHYNVKVEQKVSFLKANFNLEVVVTEQSEPEFIRTEGQGKDSKIAASLKQKSEVTLEAVSESETKMILNSQVDVFGKLASVGFSVMNNQANKIFKDFAEKVKANIE